MGHKSFVGGGHDPGPGIGVRRLSFPSGAWVDAQGNPARSPNESSPSPATANPAAASSGTAPNPDPYRYTVLAVKEIGDCLVLKIQYPDCTNFEGVKILVFKGVTMVSLINQRAIDPHFSDGAAASPVARFRPTGEGWKQATAFAQSIARVTRGEK
jgi:hypothetical protein